MIRSGGKTKISMLIDLGALWLVGIPLGAVFVYLRLPLYIIYSGFMADQLVKGATAVLYVRTKRWICNITKPSAVTL